MRDDRPTIRLKPKSDPRPIRFGAPWVYVDQVVTDRRTKAIEPGAIATLVDADKKPLATVAANPNSKIIARVLDLDPGAEIDGDWIAQRVAMALSHRETLFDAPFYRLIHAEADGFPGVIVDRFGEVLVVQPNAAWAEAKLDLLCDALTQATGATTIYKNASGRTRELEGLDTDSKLLTGDAPGLIQVSMNGATYVADVVGGQKTGLFFDQRPNHAFAASLSKGARVLDVFSHVGGFGLAALAGGANSALAVDASVAALELARQGAEAAGVSDKFETRQGDAFDVLQYLADAKETFDVVVCDPPAFAPSKPALEAGLRAYERVARLSAQLVPPGGYLGLCSCSHAADLSKFQRASLRGIARAGRKVQLIHVGSAGPDHPRHPSLAESSYLKALFFRVLA